MVRWAWLPGDDEAKEQRYAESVMQAVAAGALDERYTNLRLALIDRKRGELQWLRRTGVIDDTVVRKIHSDLDVEELRMVGLEPLD